ncbi:Fe(2+) transporter permease subunit FeoB [uncultured Cohaesibacter sp.]|uniref:Fe(2+) transporter permease subunit FeoB n=1 Tax=uncultured Cohaesibacter sp. TaxID=1002546 RepID=UPI002AA8BF10|nr:Fe(2+) transporter permease subunit FeoB [uncultured Cohaesibacter sp.]
MTDIRIAFAGNPNCGKTTLFNALTGARQHVGNWPGVTIDRKEGHYTHNGQEITIVDLPGTYSLDTTYSSGLDEAIARDYILEGEADLVVNIVDAANLERNLFLTSQLLDMRVPMIVALTKTGLARKEGIEIDADQLSRRLKVPVIAVDRKDRVNQGRLKDLVEQAAKAKAISDVAIDYDPSLEEVLERLERKFADLAKANGVHARWLAVKSLGGDGKALSFLDQGAKTLLDHELHQIQELNDEDADLLIADGRYGFANMLAQDVIRHIRQVPRTWTERIDSIALSRILGIPIFLMIMYFMFLLTINLASAFIDFFDILAGTVIVDGPAHWMASMGMPEWLIALLPNGVGVGIQTVATFVPVVAFLFLFLTFLEESGYMARAAFVVDRAMISIGLPGKSFVPMLLGFGCNVPAIMASRTLDNPRDRIVTALMAPFMSCGARLPVYALFAAAFFPTGGQNLVFLLYIIGILFAVFTGLVLKKAVFGGKALPFLMELPPYQLPSLSSALIRTWDRVKQFILGAGKVIVAVVFVLSILNSMGTDGSFGHDDSEHSVLANIGKALTPVVEPLGITEANWPATVGLFTGVFAKEAVVGTLNSLYSQIDATNAELAAVKEDEFDFFGGVAEAFASIPANLSDMTSAFEDPLGISVGDVSTLDSAATELDVDNSTFAAMITRFDGKVGAFAYLLLILLYVPCVAAVGALFREIGRKWTLFGVGWTTMLGYCTSVFAYQAGTIARHPQSSIIWMISMVAAVAVVVALLHIVSRNTQQGPGKLARSSL